LTKCAGSNRLTCRTSLDIALARKCYSAFVKAVILRIYRIAQRLGWVAIVPILKKLIIHQSSIYLTCDRTDGGGAQLHGRISTIAFARHLGIKYFSTPLRKVDYASVSDLKSWNEVIDFSAFSEADSALAYGARYIKVESVFKLVLAICSLLLFQRVRNSITLFEVPHCHEFTNLFPHLIMGLRQELRANVGSTISKVSGQDCVRAVIHVRGAIGGVEDDSPRRSSFTLITHKISHARSVADRVVIYSSEYDSRLESAGAQQSEIDSSSDVFQVLRCMAQAEYLYMAKSSLSYVGALLCRGQVHYEPFWHPAMADWLLLEG